MSISVIIPVCNGGDGFVQCLKSIDSSNVDEIIVVDDGSTDESPKIAQAMGATLLSHPQSRGPAVARNRGARHAEGDILLFIDADVTLLPDTIERVKAAFQQNPEVSAFIGSYDDAPGAPNFLSQYKNLFHHYTHQNASQQACTFWGACGAIRREVFLEVEGFDERYRYPSVEDIDLGYRLVKAGYHIQLDKTIQVKHLKHWKPGSLLRAEIFYRALPWTELIWRDRQFVNDLNLNVSSRVSLILAYILLVSLLMTWWWSGAIAIAGLSGVALLILNFPVYQFFQRKRGLGFAIRVIPWHWLYFIYGGFAFALGTVRYHLKRAG